MYNQQQQQQMYGGNNIFNQQQQQPPSSQQRQYQQYNQQNQFNPQQQYQQQPQQFQYQQQQQQQQLDCLEMDHLQGFSGKFPHSSHFHPTEQNKMIYSVGGLIVIENSEDKHDQVFLRGHDMAVSALAVSPSGRYVASGQLGSTNTKYHESPVILWDYVSQKPINVFKGLQDGIQDVLFSNDDKFVAATGFNNTLTIWNTQDFTVVYNKLQESPITLLCWSSVSQSASRHNSYVLITAQGNQVIVNTLNFNVGSMQYTLSQKQCQLPSSGLIRTYTTGKIDSRGEYLYIGTTAGEIAIFNIPNLVFKAAIPICNNGVLSLSLLNDTLFVGSGDGRLKKLRGEQTKWSLESEVQLEGSLNGQSVSVDQSEILVGSNFSKLYRIQVQTLNASIHTDGHLSPILGLAFQKGKNDQFATIDAQGYILVWDNNDLNIITKCLSQGMTRSKGTCVCIDNDDGSIIAGFEDGFIRCFQVTNNQYSPMQWELANSHKGGVTSIYADQNYILSGGADGQVRVWSRAARQLLQQISIHTKDVIGVFPDISKPHVIHSASSDKSIHSFDLKTAKKVIYHSAKNGVLLHMSQRRDSEQELVTCGLNTPILFWDCDVIDPVQSINIQEKLNCIEVSNSGKFMAAGNDKGEVLVYEVATTRFMGRFLGHSVGISKLQWSPDEKQIISVSYDNSLAVWNFFQD